MQKKNNAAFIDAQNLHLGIASLGWKLDYRRFRIYLRDRFGVGKAYLFLGYIPKHQDLYTYLQACGFILIFKEIDLSSPKAKGNTDVDLTLHALLQITEYEKAVIVSSDGDFASLVKHLVVVDKLEIVLSPYIRTCSWLLKKAANGHIRYLDQIRGKLELKHK